MTRISFPTGVNSEAEFFSVASEYFFQRPSLFKRKHPDLHQLIRRVFRHERE